MKVTDIFSSDITLVCSGKDSVILKFQFLSQQHLNHRNYILLLHMFLNLLDPNVSFKQIDNIYFSTLSIARYLMIFDISNISFFDANHFNSLM